jgi:hypothetical protein
MLKRVSASHREEILVCLISVLETGRTEENQNGLPWKVPQI